MLQVAQVPFVPDTFVFSLTPLFFPGTILNPLVKTVPDTFVFSFFSPQVGSNSTAPFAYNTRIPD
jgi:hypothetical protein